jgi:hypothetical protein
MKYIYGVLMGEETGHIYDGVSRSGKSVALFFDEAEALAFAYQVEDCEGKWMDKDMTRWARSIRAVYQLPTEALADEDLIAFKKGDREKLMKAVATGELLGMYYARFPSSLQE